MKRAALFSIIMVMFFSCTRKRTYELTDISHPVLDEWIAYYQSVNSDLSLDKFKKISGFIKYENSLFWYSPYVYKTNIYSPNRHYYIDLDVYANIEDDIYFENELDGAYLIDVGNRRAAHIMGSDYSSFSIDDAFWINDSDFVILSYYIDFDDDYEYLGLNLEITIEDVKGNGLAYYVYNDVIEPDELYIIRRLRRQGIKYWDYNDLIHDVEVGETVYGISRQYGISQEELKYRNPELEHSVLQAGRKLVIPQR